MTRWHGTMIAMGFAWFAPPTARTAAGLPMRRASSPYDHVEPYGMERSMFHTESWNSVPIRCTGTVKWRNSRLKYAASCRFTSMNGPSEASQQSAGVTGLSLPAKLKSHRPCSSPASRRRPTGLSVNVYASGFAYARVVNAVSMIHPPCASACHRYIAAYPCHGESRLS